MAAILPALIQAAATIGGSYLSRDKGQKISPIQKRQTNLLDQIMDAIGGTGPLADFVNTDEDAFQRSIVDPAMQRFQGQIAPGIQQQFISDRLQRGTGLDDALARSGVDINSLINQKYLEFINSNKDRLGGLLTSALGANPPQSKPAQSGLEAGLQGVTGLLSQDKASQGFADALQGLFSGKQEELQASPFSRSGSVRTGFVGVPR